MRHHSRTNAGLIGGLGAAVATLSFFVSLELSTATASAQKAATSSEYVIDRALKGDRLPASVHRSSNVGSSSVGSSPVAEPALPVGCEPLFSSIGRKIKTGTALHCFS
jgi:hypothetical protein